MSCLKKIAKTRDAHLMRDFLVKVPKTVRRFSERETANPQYLMMRRIASGKTITEIAKEAEVSKAFVSAVENGKKSCPHYLLVIYEALEPQDGIAFLS